MRVVLSLVLIFTLGACSSVHNPKRVYLMNAATAEIVKCEESNMDSWFSALEMCIKNKEKDGFTRIEVTKFNRYGYPVEYYIEEDPYWPKN